jgi:parallel beta-helix repeat protein
MHPAWLQRAWGTGILTASVVALLATTSGMAATSITTCPMTIAVSGDYQLSADLTCPGDGIAITANAVHVQMGGHVLTGTGTGLGITATSGDVDIQNGTLQGFAVGVRLSHAQGVTLVAVTATENTTGLVLDHAHRNEFTDTLVMHNAGDGILAFSSTHNMMTASVGNNNGGAGLVGQDFADNVLTGNGFHENAGDGLRLDGASHGNLLRSNDVSDNLGHGIVLGDADENTLKANHVRGNSGTGICVQAGSTQNLLQGNSAQQNSGLDVADLTATPCVANTWKSNNFATDSEGDGAQAGCLQ